MDEFERRNTKPTPAGIRSDSHLSKWIWLVPTIALVAAVLPLPYGFYMGLRWLIAAASIFLAWKEYELSETRVSTYVVVFGAIALVYNPIMPLHLSKSLWVVLNLITAATFFGHYRLRLSNG